MRKLLFLFFLLSVAVVAQPQSVREELRQNPSLAASNFLAYPSPSQQRLTPAPKGKKPFYISHYGRHGSRYHTKAIDYEYALETLRRADAKGALNSLGKDVLQRLTAISAEASDRLGDLTPLGVEQQHDIASRMYSRFPEVFKKGAVVDARSTVTPRCILTMAHFTSQLLLLNPKLEVKMDASEHDHTYLRQLFRLDASTEASARYKEYCDLHECWQRPVGQLFADTAYLNRYVNGERLNYYLFREAINLQSSELGKTLSLFDLFTSEELYEMWRMNNVWWYLGFGFSDLNGGNIPFSQANLLRNIIEQADSCLHLPRPGCSLRFGHDTAIMPLVCLLNLNGYGRKFADLELLDSQGWVDYRISPMSSNVQFVFYRSSTADDDVLFKVLLNENEATLPLPDDLAPYYHWNDFRRYYLELLDSYSARP